ncbi:MAG: hypothetical protein ACKO3T_05900 [Planctomycetaceae bacterium]
MNIPLDPVVVRRLQQFGQRRRMLLTVRGFSAGLSTFLLCLGFAAAVDWYWLLTDVQRWILSACVYVPGLLAAWLACGRQLFRAPASDEIAMHVEQTEPQLREKLLAAVELAADDPAGLHDSPMFRSLLQGEVAARMGKVQPSAVLPFRLVAKWTAVALVIAAIFLSLLAAPDPRFRQLAVRTILPMANLARVSRVQVQILQPIPHSLLLPEDETAAVIVQTSGGAVSRAVLESKSETAGVVRYDMQPQAESRFAANLRLEQGAVEYRILAGDAITQWHRITTRPRPRVEQFTKLLQFPDYSQLEPVSSSGEDGHLQALQGTVARLTIQPSQPVSAAELRLDPLNSEEPVVIPLVPLEQQGSGTKRVAGGLWTAAVPIQDPGTYRVHLVSQETGFENVFSPRYEIRPQPDLIPRTGFVDQQQTTLLLPPDDILQLRAMAEDDLPLVSLEQQISINGEEWFSLPLQMTEVAGSEGRSVTVEWDWDLVPHTLRPGDQLLTKLSAVDRRGSRGESAPLRIVIADREFDPDRHTQMQQKLQLQPPLKKLAAQLEEQKTAAAEILERLKSLPADAPQAVTDRTALQDLAGRQRQAAEAVLQQTQTLLRNMPAAADATDLELTGRVLAKLTMEQPNAVLATLQTFAQAADPRVLQADLNEVKRNFDMSADDAKNLAEHFSWLAAWNLFDAASHDLQMMLEHQEFVVSSPTQTWRRLLRQQSLLVTQLETFERLLQDERAKLPEPIVGHATRLIDFSAASREQLQQAMESEDRLPQLQALTKQLRDQLLQYQKLQVLDGDIPGRLQNAWRDLENRTGPLAGLMDAMTQAAAERAALLAQAAKQREAADDAEKTRQLEQQAARSTARMLLRFQPGLQQLRSRQKLAEARPDADLQYAADAGLAVRAIDAVLYLQQTEDPDGVKLPEQMREIAPAWRTLEAGHELSLALAAMARLQELERWGSRQRTARINQPRHWDLLQHAADVAARRLGEARIDGTLINRLNQTRWSAEARDAGRRISERRWRRDVLTSTGHELDNMAAEMAAAAVELQPAMAQARAVLAKYAPTISQLAERAAEQVRALEEQTLQAADAAEQQPQQREAEQPQLAQLQQQQQQVNDQIQDLLQALVEDAERQDPAVDEQRERARDSDDSMALIQPPAERMNQELQQAAAAAQETRQQELAEAAEQQEQTAKALETVAEHFKALEQGQEVAETRAELRKVEQQQGLPPELAAQYQQAEAMDQELDRSAEQQLQELEAELQRNPAMQEALSEIARNALADAESVLQEAAAEDQSLQQANERSDTDFQNRKRELAEDLRQTGTQAAQLSGMLVAQAAQAAAQGKAPEAQAKLAETQQKLNAAAAAASSAREEQLLSELQQTTANVKQAIQEAATVLNEGRAQTAAAKDQVIFPEAAAREAQQKNSEKQRQAFREQQKQTANNNAKQAEEAVKRAQQTVKNVENEVRTADKRVEQAQQQLNRKPADAGLQQQLAAQQQARQLVQDRLDDAQRQQDRATQKMQAAQQNRDAANNPAMPPLTASNPAAQLAEQYAGEAAESLEKLKQAAEALQTDFGSQLTPAQNQLAAAEQRQQELTEDVQLAAADVARAARHERRLNNPAVAETLQQTAQSIQQAASQESTAAEQQLEAAATEAGQQAAQPQTPPANAQALEAQRDLEAAEQAFTARAAQIEQALNPLEQAAAAAEAAAAEAAVGPDPAGEPATGQQPAGQQPAGQQPAGQQPAGQQPSGQAPAGEQPAAAQPGEQPGSLQAAAEGQAAALTPEQQAQAVQLAQTLDELDRQLAAAQAQAAQSGQQQAQQQTGSQPAQQPLSQAQAAQAQQARLAAARRQAQQQALRSLAQSSQQSADGFSEPPDAQPFEVSQISRAENANWGRLRGQAAEDVARGRGEQISEAWRKSVETYFRVLSERSRKPQ